MFTFIRRNLVLSVSAGLLLIFLAVGYMRHRLQISCSDMGFQFYTGVALPLDVRAVAYNTAMNDNFFHTTHYWFLSGPGPTLRRLAMSFCQERSDEDARWALPDMKEMFGMSQTSEDVIEGYEGNCAGGRDRWMVIFRNNSGAVFMF